MARSAFALQALPLVQVLLVEDNSGDAFLIENLLNDGKEAKYKTCHVKTQADALAALQETTFDVCLLDLTLPDSSEFSALIDIQDKAPELPVLILTGMKDTELARRAVGRGAQDYLLKDEMEIGTLARAIDYAMERKRLEKTLFQRANYDALTGLANRDMFQSRLELALSSAARSGLAIAVLFIDLDHFKPINDAHGHDAGDAVLKVVTQRIQSVLRAYDTAARFGGDEFAVVLEGIGSPRDAASIARKIIAALTVPISHLSYQLEVGASIGIVFSEEPTTAELLLHHADIAMYHAKKDGGSAYRFYVDHMHAEVAARLSMEEALRTALLAKQFQLYYQPYYSSSSGVVLGVEALLRWNHPERGVMCAQEFLAAAEGARIMPEIARWVCSEMQRNITMWNAQSLPPLSISMNLSVSQLDAPELLKWLMPLVQKDFIGYHRLTIEIPEEIMAPMAGARYITLAKMHEMGIELHIDHFGHRWLPLTTLCELPFRLLKIDRALIRNMTHDIKDNILVGAAIVLARHLGMKVGAVGVEEQWQMDQLKAQECDVIQGMYAAEPMPAEQLAEWLKKGE